MTSALSPLPDVTRVLSCLEPGPLHDVGALYLKGCRDNLHCATPFYQHEKAPRSRRAGSSMTPAGGRPAPRSNRLIEPRSPGIKVIFCKCLFYLRYDAGSVLSHAR